MSCPTGGDINRNCGEDERANCDAERPPSNPVRVIRDSHLPPLREFICFPRVLLRSNRSFRSGSNCLPCFLRRRHSRHRHAARLRHALLGSARRGVRLDVALLPAKLRIVCRPAWLAAATLSRNMCRTGRGDQTKRGRTHNSNNRHPKAPESEATARRTTAMIGAPSIGGRGGTRDLGGGGQGIIAIRWVLSRRVLPA